MRYVVQLSRKDDGLTERLGEVKDQIGEWHDWTELDRIAKDVLSDCKGCDVISKIQRTARQKFEAALRNAQQLRSHYFQPQGGRQKQNPNKPGIKGPVLAAAAGLAAES